MTYFISNSSLNVLVIDENTEILNMLAKVLFCIGHSATVFSNPAEALEELTLNENYDAVITDCFLDIKSMTFAGIDLIESLLDIKKLPVLVWSMYVDRLIPHIHDKEHVTFLKKPEENLSYIFTWLDKIKKIENEQFDTYPIYQLIYSSKEIDGFTENDLMDILISSRKHNKTAGISGALIYHNKCFLQVLEGEQVAVENMYYELIEKDKRHVDVTLLTKGIVNKRIFLNWDMGFFGNHDGEDYVLLGLTDFDKHPAGQFFRDKLTHSQKELLSIQ
jgi:CheY-like chemotaxis protein